MNIMTIQQAHAVCQFYFYFSYLKYFIEKLISIFIKSYKVTPFLSFF